jgi:hypothetical protein
LETAVYRYIVTTERLLAIQKEMKANQERMEAEMDFHQKEMKAY